MTTDSIGILRGLSNATPLESSEIPLKSDDEPGRTKRRPFVTVTIWAEVGSAL